MFVHPFFSICNYFTVVGTKSGFLIYLVYGDSPNRDICVYVWYAVKCLNLACHGALVWITRH